MEALVKVNESQPGIISGDYHFVLTKEYYTGNFTTESKFTPSILTIYLGGPIKPSEIITLINVASTS
jgi:hypothetical protein